MAQACLSEVELKIEVTVIYYSIQTCAAIVNVFSPFELVSVGFRQYVSHFLTRNRKKNQHKTSCLIKPLSCRLE
jgi:hypothetical protein